MSFSCSEGKGHVFQKLPKVQHENRFNVPLDSGTTPTLTCPNLINYAGDQRDALIIGVQHLGRIPGEHFSSQGPEPMQGSRVSLTWHGQMTFKIPGGNTDSQGQMPNKIPGGNTDSQGQMPYRIPGGNTDSQGQMPFKIPGGNTDSQGQMPYRIPGSNTDLAWANTLQDSTRQH